MKSDRSARTTVGGQGVAGPSERSALTGRKDGPIRSRLIGRRVAQGNSTVPVQGAALLNASLRSFFDVGESALRDLEQAQQIEEDYHLAVENAEQKSKGRQWAESGKSLEDAGDLRNDRDFTEAYHTALGDKHGRELFRDWKDSILAGWSPYSSVDLAAETETWLAEEIGKGTGDPLFDNAMRAAFMNRAEGILNEAGPRRWAAVRDQALREQRSTIHAAIQDGTFEPDHYLTWVSDARTALPLKSEGEVRATVLGSMYEATLAGSTSAQTQFVKFLHEAPVGPDGKTLAAAFPEQIERLTVDTMKVRHQHLNSKAFAAYESLDQGIDEAVATGDAESLRNLADGLMVTRDQWGGVNEYHRLKGKVDQAMTRYAESRVVAEKMDQASRGQAVSMTPKEYDEGQIAYLKSKGLDFTDPSLSGEDRRAIAPQAAAAVYRQYQSQGDFSKPIKQWMGTTLTMQQDPEAQLTAFEFARSLDAVDEGLGSKLFAGNAEAAGMYALLKQHPNPPLLLAKIHDDPDFPRKVRDTKLGPMFGTDDEAEAEALLFGGEHELLDFFGSDEQSLAEILAESGVIPEDAEGADIPTDSPLHKRIATLAKIFSAGAESEGRTVDGFEVRERIAQALRGQVAVELTGEDAYRLVINKTPPVNPGGGYVAALPQLTNAKGAIEYPLENLRESVHALNDMLGLSDTQVTFKQGSHAHMGAFDVMVADEELGFSTPAVLSMGPNRIGERAFELSGDFEVDRKAFKSLAPKGLELAPYPDADNPDRYQIVAFPYLKDTDPPGLTDAELAERAELAVEDIPDGLRAQMRQRGLGAREQQELLYAKYRNGTPQDAEAPEGDSSALQVRETMQGLLREERSKAQADGKISPTLGITKPDPALDAILDQTQETTPMDYLEFLHDETSKARGPAGHDKPSDQTSYKERRFEFIGAEEAWRAQAYDDIHGYRTVGYGFNLDAAGNRELMRQTLKLTDEQADAIYYGKLKLTQAQGKALFDAAVAVAENIVSTKFEGVALTEHQRLALVSLAYNGGSGLIGKNLTRQVREGDWEAAVDEILHRSNARKVKGLASRRWREAAMFAGQLNADARQIPPFDEYMKTFV